MFGFAAFMEADALGESLSNSISRIVARGYVVLSVSEGPLLLLGVVPLLT